MMKRFKKILSLLIALCMLTVAIMCVPVVAHAEDTEEPDPVVDIEYVENELLIRVDDSDNADSALAESAICSIVLSNLSASLNAEVSADYTCTVNDESNLYVVSIDNVNNDSFSIPDLCADINADNNGMYAEPNYICELTDTEASIEAGLTSPEFQPLYSTNGIYPDWHIRDTFVTEALGYCEKQGDDVVVAVIDSGCNFEHEHLQNSMITFEMWPYTYHGFSVVENEYLFDITDNHGHGTAVSSIISGSNTTNNIKGIAGNAKIFPIKVTNTDTFPVSNLIKAIEMIQEYNTEIVGKEEGAEHPISIVNMSFRFLRNITYNNYSTSVKMAIDSLADDCVLVAAAGNDKINTNQKAAYPAGFQNVIGVMAYDSNRTMAEYSNYDEMGYHYNIAAPGSNITVASHSVNNGYVLATGTSFASPIVAGAVALYMSNCPDASIEKAKSDLLLSMTDKVERYYKYDDVEGHYKLNVANYLNLGLLNDNSVFSGSCGYDDVTWTYTHSNRSLVISGSDTMDDYTRGGAPWYRFRDLITSCDISDDIVYIGDYAFTDLSVLNNLDLGEGIECIGNLSFAYCKALTSLVLPDNEFDAAFGSFYACSSLTSIVLPSELYSASSAYYIFQNCTALTNVTIPEGWTNIPTAMFFGCTDLANVVLPDTVSIIGAAAFKGCCSLININLPEGLVDLRPRAFENCIGLTSVDLPRSLEKIKSKAFAGCSNLETVTIYDNLTMMQPGIFNDCPEVTVRAYCNSTALNYVQSNEVDFEIMYRLNPIENSGITFDRANNWISGLSVAVSTDVFEEQYISLDSGYTIGYENNTSGLVSAGTIVNVLKSDTIVETYTVV